jgi:hypothetical protein
MLQQLLAAPSQHVLAAGFIRAGITAVFLLIVAEFIFVIICALVAKAKGYSAILFAVLGFFFSIITLIIVLVLPRRR